MYLDPRGFVLLCQPKTGTSTARYVCGVHGPGTTNTSRVHLGVHQWREHVLRNHGEGWTRELAENPDTRVYGTVREPLAWYRSAYRFAMSPRVRGGEAQVKRWCGTTDYHDALREWTRRGGLPGPVRDVLNPAPDTTAPTLYQASVMHYYGETLDGVVRLERQAEDLAALLGVDVSRVRRLPRQNVTQYAEVEDPPDVDDLLASDRAFFAAWLARIEARQV